ncbi:transcription intermediary factor 1-alpha-like isoform X2 [Littorina saxatilis]|uniref:transcription intermediary factor 1-alpha-like isoform X2 n=1 Tax=Littorina saxatilis TaxID=31220 RepID=UPI0038B699F0
MATASVAVEVSDEECPVCHEGFKKPKLLPCGHLLCRHCLLSWLQSDLQACCPLCRCAIVEPGEPASGKSWENLADSFPTDLVMAAIVESRQLLSEDHQCQFCVNQIADTFCLNCNDFLCCTCAAGHKRMSMSRQHTVELLSSLTAEKLAASRPSLCPDHKDEVCKLFCGMHGVSMCVLCATTNHRQCQQVSQLGAKAEESRATLEELGTILTQGQQELGAAIDQLDQSLQDSETRKQAALADIQVMRDRLQSALDACGRRLTDQALTAHSDVKEAVLDRKTRLLGRRGKLTSHKDVIDRVRDSETCDAVCEMRQPLETRVKGLDRSVTLPSDAMVVSVTTLEIDSDAVSRLERELSELGQPVAFSFHNNHGKHVVLSNDEHTAERTALSSCCIVVSRDPMQDNMLYEVRIDETESRWGYHYVYLGAVTQSLDTLTLPSCDWSGNMTSAVVLHHDWVKMNGVESKSSVGSALCDVREEGRVGLALDSSRQLCLYIDGHHQGVVAPDVTQPCYLMVDLHASWKKVTALPVRPVTSTSPD